MAEIALTDVERAFLAALDDLGIRYMVVGLSAAVLQGADTVTADIDLWLENRADPRIHEAAERAGGLWIPGHFGMAPPMLGGDELADRFDIVTNLHGLQDFQTEYSGAVTLEVAGLQPRGALGRENAHEGKNSNLVPRTDSEE
jgi:hypothetical protein